MTWNMAGLRARNYRTYKPVKPVGVGVPCMLSSDGVVELPAHPCCGYLNCDCDGKLGAKVARKPCGCMYMTCVEAARVFGGDLKLAWADFMSRPPAWKFSDGHGRNWMHVDAMPAIVCRCVVCEQQHQKSFETCSDSPWDSQRFQNRRAKEDAEMLREQQAAEREQFVAFKARQKKAQDEREFAAYDAKMRAAVNHRPSPEEFYQQRDICSKRAAELVKDAHRQYNFPIEPCISNGQTADVPDIGFRFPERDGENGTAAREIRKLILDGKMVL